MDIVDVVWFFHGTQSELVQMSSLKVSCGAIPTNSSGTRHPLWE